MAPVAQHYKPAPIHTESSTPRFSTTTSTSTTETGTAIYIHISGTTRSYPWRAYTPIPRFRFRALLSDRLGFLRSVPCNAVILSPSSEMTTTGQSFQPPKLALNTEPVPFPDSLFDELSTSVKGPVLRPSDSQ